MAMMQQPQMVPVAEGGVPLDLLVKFHRGHRKQRLVLKVQDTGGQPIFLSILELLTTPECTVYLVIFNLEQLKNDFENCVQNLVEQLMSIYMFAAEAPVILAGSASTALDLSTSASPAMPSPRLASPVLAQPGGRLDRISSPQRARTKSSTLPLM